MTTINTKMLAEVRADLTSALAAVAKKHNLSSLVAGHCSYDSAAGCFTFKLEGSVKGGLSKEAALYNSLRRSHTDLPALESTFQHKGNIYTIVGSNTTGSKIMVTRGDAKYSFSREQIMICVASKK